MKNLLGQSLHQSYFVAAMCVGIVAGVVLGLVLRINFFASPVWIGFAVGLMVLAYFRPKLVFIVMALIAGMVLAFFRVSSELMRENYIQFYGREVLITGTVEGDPEMDESGMKIKLANLKFGKEGVVTSGSIYISARYNGDVARADTITVWGKLAEGFGTYAGYMYKP